MLSSSDKAVASTGVSDSTGLDTPRSKKGLPAVTIPNVNADREMLQLTYSNISERLHEPHKVAGRSHAVGHIVEFPCV